MGAQWIIDFTHAHAFHMIRWRAVSGVRYISGGNRKHREIGGKLLAGFGLGGHRRCPFRPPNQDRYIRLPRPRHGERIDQDVPLSPLHLLARIVPAKPPFSVVFTV